MSKNKNANTLLRQQTLLKYIPANEGIKSADLLNKLKSEGFEVTQRTLQRDLEVLSQYFPIYSETDTKPYLWRWCGLGINRTHIDSISVTDALSLMLVEKSLQQLLPPAMQRHLQHNFEHSRQLLNTLKDDDNAQWFEKVASVMPDIGFKPPSINSDLLTQIQGALLKDQTIEVSYLKTKNTTATEYLLMPLALVQRGHVLYVIAQDITKGATTAQIKRFAMHRFQTVTLTYEQGNRPPNFNLQQYLQDGAMQFGNGDKLSLKAKVTEELAFYLIESPMSDDMKIIQSENGTYQLSATVNNGWQLNWWLRGQAANIEVIEPQELRTRMRDNLRKTLAIYDDLIS
ncbi:WYL domain-containing protein [Shewanella sp. ULN5]|uniref:helix-turn-helix transcriptional regulator n=1 Tax=Shewanella sp. ULN5 TaxID=2994678 RepID=UPI00273F07A9|nr:WYL domain-containing protein [Shewanella sp. ULN5]MDP5146543.1 WYL domain-containing protein [Shewanella sp. ULN5]